MFRRILSSEWSYSWACPKEAAHYMCQWFCLIQFHDFEFNPLKVTCKVAKRGRLSPTLSPLEPGLKEGNAPQKALAEDGMCSHLAGHQTGGEHVAFASWGDRFHTNCCDADICAVAGGLAVHHYTVCSSCVHFIYQNLVRVCIQYFYVALLMKYGC